MQTKILRIKVIPKNFKTIQYIIETKTTTNNGFVNIDNGTMGGIHWVCFYKKFRKSNYFVSFGGPTNISVLKQLPEPITFPNLKSQDTKSRLCGKYCLHFLHRLERLVYYDALMKM